MGYRTVRFFHPRIAVVSVEFSFVVTCCNEIRIRCFGIDVVYWLKSFSLS